jgi:drug/metabolite transporter (DMT)-like permease
MAFRAPIQPVKAYRALIAIAASLTAVLIWGAWFPLTKIAVASTSDEWEICIIRFTVSGIIALPILQKMGYGLSPGLGGVGRAVVLAICAGVGYVAVACIALELAPSMYGMVTPVSMATSTSVLTSILNRRGIGLWTGASLLFFAAGISALIGWGSVDIGAATGIGLFMFAGVLFSVYNIYVARWRASPFHATALVSFYSFIAVLPLMIWRGWYGGLAANWRYLIWQGGYQGVLVSYVALLLFTVGVRQVGPRTAAYLVLLVPAISVLLSAQLLGEPAGSSVIAAVVLLLVGMSLGIFGQVLARKSSEVVSAPSRFPTETLDERA